MANDAIEQAIAAAQAPVPTVPLMVTLPTGREVGFVVPVDLSVGERLAITQFVSGTKMSQLLEEARGRLEQAAAPNLVIARGRLPGRH